MVNVRFTLAMLNNELKPLAFLQTLNELLLGCSNIPLSYEQLNINIYASFKYIHTIALQLASKFYFFV